MAKLIEKLEDIANSHYFRVVAFAVFGVLVGAILMTLMTAQTVDAPTQDELEKNEAIEEKSVAVPVRLRIPSVNIDADFGGSLGLNDDQTIEVPKSYEELGWYKYGPRPGELGPAVVLGHVDSYQGPAVFFRLGQTKVGDIIEIEREDGSVAKFEITEHLRRSQSDFPTTEVYSDIDHAGLRLITCTGTYNHGTQVYSHNLIVFAKLVEEINVDISQ